MKQVAKVLLRDVAGDYLMLEHTNHPTFPDDPDFPGGTVELGETPLQGAVREVIEEISVELVPARLELLYQGTEYSRHGTQYSLYIYQCDERPEVLLSWEHTAFGWERPDTVIAKCDNALDTFMHMAADQIRQREATPD